MVNLLFYSPATSLDNTALGQTVIKSYRSFFFPNLLIDTRERREKGSH